MLCNCMLHLVRGAFVDSGREHERARDPFRSAESAPGLDKMINNVIVGGAESA